MKKALFVAVAALLVLLPVLGTVEAKEKDTMAGICLSYAAPGTGEWYNNDFKGSFPWAECIVGRICFCVTMSSVFDAAAGKTNTDMRFDFWTPPSGR